MTKHMTKFVGLLAVSAQATNSYALGNMQGKDLVQAFSELGGTKLDPERETHTALSRERPTWRASPREGTEPEQGGEIVT